MSRRNTCTKETVEKVKQLKANGLLDKDIAAIVGVNPRTFSRWVNQPKTENQRLLGDALKSSEGMWRASLENRIIKASENDWKAAAWLLERKDPMNYSLSPNRFAASDTEEDALSNAKSILGNIKSGIE